jgi:hypothetical protein
MVQVVLEWFKNKDNIARAEYYRALEGEKVGRGTGTFYKHMSQVFEMNMEMIQKKTKKADGANDEKVENAYKELGSFIVDLLDVLTSE